MEQIKNIIFDVGDVLLSYRWKYMLMDYGLSEEEAVRIGTEMFDDPEGLWGLLDLGTVPQQEIISKTCSLGTCTQTEKAGVRGVSAIQLFRGIIQKAYRICGFHE